MSSDRPTRRRVRTLLTIVGTAALVAPLTAYAGDSFSDVPDSNIFHDDIDWMAENGVTAGCGGDRFCPDDVVTREQMSAFMRRLDSQNVFLRPGEKAASAGSADNAAALGGVPAAAHLRAEEGALGFAWGCQAGIASYDPEVECDFEGDYAYNSEGGDISITRSAAGDYLITFEGLGAPTTGGTVSVTPYDPGICVIDTWDPVGDDVTIDIECFDFDGAPTDLRYTVQYIA